MKKLVIQVLTFFHIVSQACCLLQILGANRYQHGAKGIRSSLSRPSELFISFGWFGGKDENQDKQKLDESSVLSKDGRGSLGGIAGVMDSMERYKKAQRIGKMTATLVQDLSSMTVEGIGEDGMVKVIFDCQQRAVSTAIEVEYFESSSASEVATALTIALKDAHNKSTRLMDQVTQIFYTELTNGILSLTQPEEVSENRIPMKDNRSKSKVDRMRASINQELASNTVEGTAENGKVKAVYDGQQRPISILIDDNYFEAAFLLEDVCDAVTAALQDAYSKSAERTDEKMRSLFSELGLPSS